MMDLHHLPNQLPNEELVYFLRRHPITLTSLFFTFAIVLATPIALAWYIFSFEPTWWQSTTGQPLAVLLASAIFLFAWLFLYQQYLDYYLDSWIVTTKRILNIEQTGLFSRTVSELRLYRVQDVTATVNGLLPTMLNYGNVEIQSAGAKVRIVFEEIPRPNDIAKRVLELSERERREQLDTAVEEFGMPDDADTIEDNRKK